MPRPSASPKSHRSRESKPRETVDATIRMPSSLSIRLTMHAQIRKSDRSALASRLIDAGLRSYREDEALRTLLGDLSDPASGAA